jgi:hypothetical protein
MAAERPEKFTSSPPGRHRYSVSIPVVPVVGIIQKKV